MCEHCEGQRFDRAQVLRALRAVRRTLRGQRGSKKVDDALRLARGFYGVDTLVTVP